MLPDRVSNPGPLTYEPGALPIALHGQALQPLKLEANMIMAELLPRKYHIYPAIRRVFGPLE